MERKNPLLRNVSKLMNDGMETAFQSMILRSQYEQALDFICYCCNELPTPAMVNDIIFKILINCEDISLSYRASNYLMAVLQLTPENMSHTYFVSALLDKTEKDTDIWHTFSRFVESSLCHYELIKGRDKPDLVRHPNCDIICNFYIQIFTKHLPLASYFLEENSNAKISELLSWINKFYKLNINTVNLLQHLHRLLDYIVRDRVMEEKSLSLPEVLNQDSLYRMVKKIQSKCPDAFTSLRSQNRFFCKSNLSYLKLKISQQQIHNLLYKKTRTKDLHFLTLKTIIDNYLYLNDALNTVKETKKEKKPNAKFEAIKTGPTIIKFKVAAKENAETKEITNDTVLHKLCRGKKHGDLFEKLMKTPDIDVNEKNSQGHTPLHEACLSNSYLCVKTLAEDGKGIDFRSIDNEGRTPLHCAAHVNAQDLVMLLLNFGGVDLLNCLDRHGKRPIDHAISPEMKQFLQKQQLPKKQDIPPLEKFDDYVMYLQNLYSVLSLYFEIFGLYHIEEKDPWIQPHDECKCPHYAQGNDNTICSEDFAAIEKLPEKLKAFFLSIKEKAEELGLEISNQLLPLKAFASTLEK